ncbi:MAG: tRNA preQ1(34) S-adenosylmethionine ribosyltransferase-isomerase QueA [bacterium]
MDLKKFEELRLDELVAREPASPRDSSRLMVLDRRFDSIRDTVFSDITSCLKPGDCLVLNDTKVFPARLEGKKETGGKFEILLCRPLQAGRWMALSRNARPGLRVEFPGGVSAACLEKAADGEWIFEFSETDMFRYSSMHGSVPLPSYIIKARKQNPAGPSAEADLEAYQTVYARETGSIAAPTAGFHFTPELLKRIQSMNVTCAHVTLHVSWGTFKPLRGAPEKHRMLPERCSVTEESAAKINDARKRGGRIIAVGTTSARTLESMALENGNVLAGEKDTGIFIYPPYKFRTVDALLTNFHLPDSTPLCMTAALAGEDMLLAAYRQAAEKKYRFYSYGDAMLIV